MNKPAYKSLAIISGCIYGFIGVLEANGLVPDGLGTRVAETGEALSAIGAIWGVRRALPGA